MPSGHTAHMGVRLVVVVREQRARQLRQVQPQQLLAVGLLGCLPGTGGRACRAF